MLEDSIILDKKEKLKVTREKIVDSIIESEDTIGSLYTPLHFEELLKSSKDKVKIVIKDAKKTKKKVALDYKAHIFESVFSKKFFSDDDIWDIIDSLEELYNFSKEQIVTLKKIKKYINNNLRIKNYKYAGLVDILLEAIKELDFELNEYKEDTLFRKYYHDENFSHETGDLSYAVSMGLHTLVLNKPNKKKP